MIDEDILRGIAVKIEKFVCSQCGSWDNLVVHHRRYPAKNLDDLDILCAFCHGALPRKARLKLELRCPKCKFCDIQARTKDGKCYARFCRRCGYTGKAREFEIEKG